MNRSAISRLRLQPRKGIFAALIDFLRVTAARRRDRLTLAKLDPHLLRDIGLDAETASEECAKPLWRA